MKRQFYYLIIVSLSTLVFSQDPELYKEIYFKTYLEISQTDFDKALEIADSLYQISENDLFRTKSLMLTASLYERTGDIGNGIKYAQIAESYSSKTNDYVWKTRVLGFLATQYRILNLVSQSRKYAEKAFDCAKKIQDEELGNSTLGLMKQEMAFESYHRKEHQETIHHLREAYLFFQKTKTNKEILISDIEQFLGRCFINLNQVDSAMCYLEKSLETYRDFPDSHINGLAYKGKGDVYLKMGNIELAEENFNKALEISKSVSHLEFKKVVYQSFMDLNTETRNMNDYLFYKSKRDSISNLILGYKSNFFDESITDLTEQYEYVSSEISKRNYMILIAVFVTVVLILWFILYRVKQKKNINKFKEIIENIQEEEQKNAETLEEIKQQNTENQNHSESIEETIEETSSKPYMLNETEERILTMLAKFEQEERFTKKSITLSHLALYCDTNTKYLSQVINSRKNKDFNNYINELRVNYIIKKLKNEPVYRKYKIATLAEEAGFSSQNKFSTVFKAITSISPSIFIKYLDEEI